LDKKGRRNKERCEQGQPPRVCAGQALGRDTLPNSYTHLPRDLAFENREQMLRMKSYEPHCPSPTCTERDRIKLYPIRGKPNWLPPEVWASKKDDEILYRCACCGLVWFQERSKRPGLDARPIGYYDDPEHPWEFVSARNTDRIREENTSRYWYNVGCQRDAIHSPKRGGVD
jgi:hypothetical protein